MFTGPQLCPTSDLNLAAKTITSVFCQSYPLSAFVYNCKTPLSSVPYGKRELLSIWLRKVRQSGLVLTIDDGDEKCVGVAVWTGPERLLGGRLSRLRFRWFTTCLDIWLFFNMIYYKGAGMDGKVRRSLFAPSLTLEKSNV